MEINEDYLTFEELKNRWNCEIHDLVRLIVSKKIVPSIFWSAPSFKVSFSLSDGDEKYFNPVLIINSGSNDVELGEYLHRTEGAYYLIHPEIKSPFDFTYSFFSKNRNHVKKDGIDNYCYVFDVSREHQFSNGLNVKYILSNGFFMLSEILEYENKFGGSLSSASNISRWPWG